MKKKKINKKKALEAWLTKKISTDLGSSMPDLFQVAPQLRNNHQHSKKPAGSFLPTPDNNNNF